MAQCERAARPLLQSLRQSYRGSLPVRQFQQSHGFSSTAAAAEEAAQTEAQKVPFYKAPDPELVSSPRLERRLVRAGTPPIGSRRRRVALQSSANIPFELLPYQCFQEARKVLLEDRAEKLKQIESEWDKIARLRATDAEQVGGELRKQNRLRSMEKYLEKLKILADINDPMVKKRFEDGLGDMNRPIYRYLADQQWRKYRRLILEQRITQMKVIPDVLPHCDPIVDVRLYFAGKQVQPGEFVNSRVSTTPPKLNIQSFQKGEKLVTIAVVDSDVPNLETDSFDYRCHYLAVNIPISPTETKVDLQALSADSQVALPWFPPYSQKGSPYHRLSIFVMEQKDNQLVDHKAVVERAQRENFKLRSFETIYKMKPIGVHLFRSQWDENTADVMNEAGIEGADVEFRRKRVEPLPYKRRNLGKYR